MNQPAPAPSPPALPVSLAANPKLSSWLKFSSDGQVTVSPGKVEIGQGIVTALAQIAADELDIDLSRVQMVRASTAASPNEGVTSGSLSIHIGPRAAPCLAVRRIFLRGGGRLGVDIVRSSGRHHFGPGNVRTSYWDSISLIPTPPPANPKIPPRRRPGIQSPPPHPDRFSGRPPPPPTSPWRESSPAACPAGNPRKI